jgi:hypothetical protein
MVCNQLSFIDKERDISAENKMKICCYIIKNENRDWHLKARIITLISLHLIDSGLSIVSPVTDLAYLSKSDVISGLFELNSYLIVSRWVRNTIDLITGLSCLSLGNSIADRKFKSPNLYGSPKE